MFDRDIRNIMLIFVVIYIVIYINFYYNNPIKKHLHKQVFKLPFNDCCCSWWPISHFVLYGILAYLYPHKWKFIFLIGLAWEIYEIIFFTYFERKGVYHVIQSPSGKLIKNGNPISATLTDTIFNGAGIVTALALRKVFSK
tara:strand:- start:4970 stop:5392 length:423 start_codon:yes stop_codon:yes gene_type:complete